jgi:3-oxochol-4-en-24-oyl-CoA dehydrogenase
MRIRMRICMRCALKSRLQAQACRRQHDGKRCMSMDTQEEFRDSARDFLGRTDHLRRARRLRGSAPGFERDVWHQLAGAGWLSALLPAHLGGLDLGMREIAAISEETGAHLLPEPFIASGVQFARLLCMAPDGALKTRLAAALHQGRLVAGVAWQETMGQEERDLPETTACDDGDCIVLSGRKQFVVPGSGADGWIVSATRAGRPELLWVAANTAGLGLEDSHRVDGSVMATLTLEQARIPATCRLLDGEAARAALAAANDAARIAQGAELLGVARRALTLTLEYLNTRQQFGKPIGSFQALQHRSVDAFIQTELAAACLAEALSEVERAPRTLGAMASRIKARCAHAALLVTRLAIQFHGAMGYTDESDIGLYFKRALALSSWLGNAERHRQRYFALHGGEPMQDDDRTGDQPPAPSEADWEAMPEAEFRRLVRAFFQRHYPPHLRNMPRRLHWDEIKDWYFTLSRQGWIAPAWPRQFGGMGLPPDKLLAFIDEQEKFGVARAPDQGIVMVGPLLIRHGRPEQQQRFLPKILSGEHIWCQGYSEPNAGSDLASLRTEAVLDGADFVVNGQKTWCTLAQDATHVFLLVRTDKTVRKQAGISFLLVELASPGITIRPIRDISGHEEFCEVFFDNVRVPRTNMVGEMNGGWAIAKTLLGFERIFLGSPRQSQYAIAQLDQLARARQLFDHPAFVARFAELQLDVADLGASYARFAAIVKRGETLPASVSLLKIVATETYQKIGMLLIESADEWAGQFGDARFGEVRINILAPLLNATSATIYGGTNEIQRNIIASQVLDLPG